MSGLLLASKNNGKSSEVIRNEVISYIRNERDTIVKKAMALKEANHSETYRKEQFEDRFSKQQNHSIPLNVRKLICNLKKAVHKIMRDKGGTPFSIMRKLFLYYDSGHLGFLSEPDFKNCIKSLGIQAGDSDINEIYLHYYQINEKNNAAHGTANKGLRYIDVLEDIQLGEPTVTEFILSGDNHVNDDEEEVRFKEVTDKYKVMPERVKFYIEALQEYIAVQMRNHGGTPLSQLRNLFMMADFDYSGKVNAEMLLHVSKKVLKLEITLQDAQEVVNYYERKNKGEFEYNGMLYNDVAKGITSLLAHVENTPRTVAETKRRLAINPLYPVPFCPKPNQTLELVKVRVHEALQMKMRDSGGSYKSWVADALKFWDPRDTGYLNSIEDVKGFFKRLGVSVTTDEANAIMRGYDTKNLGKLKHDFLARDLIGNHTSTDVFFNSMKDDAKSVAKVESNNASNTVNNPDNITPIRVHAPHVVKKILEKFKRSLQITQLKTKGKMKVPLESQDILHGTFLRYDSTQTGKVDINGFIKVLKAMKINTTDADAQAFVTWFDTDGSNLLDYNTLVNQLCRSKVYNRDTDVFSSDFSNYQVTEKQLLPFLEATKEGKALMASKASYERLLPNVPSGGNDFKVAQLGRLLHLDNSSEAMIGNSTHLPGFSIGSNTSAAYLAEKERKKLKLIETKAIADIRRKMVHYNIEEKKHIIQSRLNEVESQRKEILEKYGHKV